VHRIYESRIHSERAEFVYAIAMQDDMSDEKLSVLQLRG